MKRFATGFFDSEDGFSTIELILILVVLVTWWCSSRGRSLPS